MRFSRDLADHDALQLRGLGIPQQIDRMLAIGIFLAARVVHDLLAARERADDAEPVHAAGEIGDAHVLA